MEAATPLRPARVHVLANAFVVDSLTVDDRCAAELVRARAEAGEDPARVVVEAIEIGARILDREQAGATVELFRADLEKSTRDAEAALAERASQLSEVFARKFDEAFGAESGHLVQAMERHFGEGSSVAVQHRIRHVMSEVSTKAREDLVRQFSSDGAGNPLAGFQRMAIATMRQGADQQAGHLRALNEQLTALKVELQALRAEKDKLAEVAAEHDKSTAKGRPYEEAVSEAIDVIARGQGDDCDAVGDVRGAGGRKGDVVVDIEGCAGRPRGRIVFEAKNSHRPRKQALAELDEAMAQRDADYGVWVVPGEDRLPSKGHQLREINGDKLFVVYDPEEGSRLGLEVAYSLARARVLMAKADGEGLDASALAVECERALGALEDVRRIKSQLTAATKGIDDARGILDGMAERVRGHLKRVDELVGAAQSAA
ncbi:MAG: hypothetical protein AVDCRST_MAG65-287 [uncultured Solirubrobacteraceae bacterium]|jgi:hypothetical protein|uniref:DUF2130 domain-containing protein n=1 Tax=uncultured Solirubrobacteraceae bacterium TaxID=1162706 RepID=A0A6J4RDE3_9ACTN|nr:MAG: hypothetical protein AVDCRST_MAG65-287 [uncultured Solirubrobacteraceae bacterium]